MWQLQYLSDTMSDADEVDHCSRAFRQPANQCYSVLFGPPTAPPPPPLYKERDTDQVLLLVGIKKAEERFYWRHQANKSSRDSINLFVGRVFLLAIFLHAMRRRRGRFQVGFSSFLTGDDHVSIKGEKASQEY